MSDIAQTEEKGILFDLMEEARKAQFDARSAQAAGALKIISPAKVNLFLGIGERQESGYHDAESLMHAINLHDVLYFQRLMPTETGDLIEKARASMGAEEQLEDAEQPVAFANPYLALGGPNGNVAVRIVCSTFEGIPPLDIPARDNIVFKAIDALARELNITDPHAFDITIEKHIPHQGGLGGGSTNAAAALLGAAHFWGVKENLKMLARVAAGLGSDVPFFLFGGCALFSGRGDQYVHELKPMRKNVVLIKPEGGVSTKEAYETFDAGSYPIDGVMLGKMGGATRAEHVPLYNNLAAASEEIMPLLAEIREWVESQPGCEGALLCGSGSTTFAVCETADDARRISVEARKRGWWSRSTAFGSIKAAVLPQR